TTLGESVLSVPHQGAPSTLSPCGATSGKRPDRLAVLLTALCLCQRKNANRKMTGMPRFLSGFEARAEG
ncbi:MAG: hypothetical protein ACE5JI_14935, partial [Acidobacteriota bacterium]